MLPNPLISSEGFSTVTATATGYTPASLEIHVSDAITISLPFNLSVGVGETKPLPFALPGPAPAGGLTVSIVSHNTSIATVSATAFIPGGANMPMTFPLVAYSERCRSAFRTDGDRDSEVMPIIIPK